MNLAALLSVVTILLFFAQPALTEEPVFETFTVASSVEGANRINAHGVVAGTATLVGIQTEGYIRARDGTITTFQVVPTSPFLPAGTSAADINRDGDVVGSWFTAEPIISYGFVREEDGTITSFSVPGAGSTLPAFINASKEIAGMYRGASTPERYGFVRNADGEFETFSAPGQSASYVVVSGFNSRGEIIGSYLAGFSSKPFLRRKNGKIVTIEVPGATDTSVAALNDDGDIAGTYDTGNHLFIRDAAGRFFTFDLPGAVTSYPEAINDDGDLVGSYVDANNNTHGFLRQRDGHFISIDAPGATATQVYAINDRGEMAGTFQTSSQPGVGFVARISRD